MMTDQAVRATKAGGWVQPEHRRCVHLHGSGERCKGTAKTGEKFCHPHQRYADADPMYPIKVPLLEDPDSIRFVASQAVRALATGTIPAANARSMLSGCRMALELLNYEFAREKYQSRAQGTGPGAQGPRMVESGQCTVSEDQEIVPGPQAVGEPAVVEAVAAESGSEEVVESDICQSQAESFGPRFPDLRKQWDAAQARAEGEVGRNLHRKEGESLRTWQERRRGPIEAGHPQARPAYAGVAGAGDPGAEAHEGPYRADELPFDPKCPPAYRPGLMDGWLPEHFAAYYRALSPKAPEREVRDFVRAHWDIPRADERAGWRWPAHGEDPNTPPPDSCIFWTMSEEEIAAWLHKEVENVPESDLREYAERRTRRMEEIRKLRGEGAADVPKEGEVVGV
jgi:hypothetical protein